MKIIVQKRMYCRCSAESNFVFPDRSSIRLETLETWNFLNAGTTGNCIPAGARVRYHLTTPPPPLLIQRHRGATEWWV